MISKKLAVLKRSISHHIGNTNNTFPTSICTNRTWNTSQRQIQRSRKPVRLYTKKRKTNRAAKNQLTRRFVLALRTTTSRPTGPHLAASHPLPGFRRTRAINRPYNRRARSADYEEAQRAPRARLKTSRRRIDFPGRGCRRLLAPAVIRVIDIREPQCARALSRGAHQVRARPRGASTPFFFCARRRRRRRRRIDDSVCSCVWRGWLGKK